MRALILNSLGKMMDALKIGNYTDKKSRDSGQKMGDMLAFSEDDFEITDEMIGAGLKEFCRFDERFDFEEDMIRRTYLVMREIAAKHAGGASS